jgi:hypothetical protein
MRRFAKASRDAGSDAHAAGAAPRPHRPAPTPDNALFLWAETEGDASDVKDHFHRPGISRGFTCSVTSKRRRGRRIAADYLMATKYIGLPRL